MVPKTYANPHAYLDLVTEFLEFSFLENFESSPLFQLPRLSTLQTLTQKDFASQWGFGTGYIMPNLMTQVSKKSTSLYLSGNSQSKRLEN